MEPGDQVYIRTFKRKNPLDHRREGPVTVVAATPTAVKVEGKDHWYHLNHCSRGDRKGPLLHPPVEGEASTSRQSEPWTSPEPEDKDLTSESKAEEQVSPSQGTRAQTK